MIGRRIEVVADLDRVRVFCDGRVVADHDRVWARHQSLTLPEHATAAQQLRRERIGLVRPAAEPEVETRRLTDYDTALGLTDHDGDSDGLEGHVVATWTGRWPDARTAPDSAAEIAYLTRALKAPTLRDAAGRLGERARTEAWTHEEFLVACLQREVAARETHGGEGRIRAARFPGRKSLEEFDYDHARGLKRDRSRTWAPSTSSPPRRTWCSSARPAPGRPTSPPG